MTDDDFDRFWRAYPLRTGKGKARDAFLKARKRTTLEAMLAALAWQVTQPKWIEDDGRFIPHPSTWLNQERWDDEPYENPKRSPAAIASLKDFREEMQRKREIA